MKKKVFLILFILFFGLVVAGTNNAADPQKLSQNKTLSAKKQSQILNIDVPFTKNQGQTNKKIKYYAQTFYGTSYVTSQGIVHQIKGSTGTITTITEQFLDSKRRPIQINPRGENKNTAKINYIQGNDPTHWKQNIPTYNIINLGELWSGITVKLKAHGNNVEKLFYVAPGADPTQIQVQIIGADKLQTTTNGQLQIIKNKNKIELTKPTALQDGKKIAVKYKIKGNTYSFILGKYNHKKSLIIDPQIDYSTYLGGSSSDSGNGIAVDNYGCAYITGTTFSNNFPTKNPYQPTYKDPGDDFYGGDVFVTKINASGTSLIYSTYIGGTKDEWTPSIVIDGSGCAYITGYTHSADFPIKNAYQTVSKGKNDIFVAKFNSLGGLVYSTYLGGTNDDYGNDIAVDQYGSAYITGSTTSNDFPTIGAYQSTYKGGYDDFGGLEDAFVTKLNPNGNTLGYSTYLGGTKNDNSNAIAVDGSGCAYITGTTYSNDFPTKNPYQSALKGPYEDHYGDAFVTKLSTSGNSLIYSTYLGSTHNDGGNGIAVDKYGCAYITGYVGGNSFPTLNPYQSTINGEFKDVFVTKLNPSGTSLAYSTYLGGTGDDYGNAIAVDGSGCAYITGITKSFNFPTKNPYQTIKASYMPGYSVFVTKLNPSGNTLNYSTYNTGSSSDEANDIAVDQYGSAYITGETNSNNFPIKNPYQSTLKGSGDVFVTKIITDIANPTVTALDPLNNALNVAPNKVIRVTFSEPVKPGNMWIELKNSAGSLIPITSSIGTRVLTINHSSLLKNGKYTLILHSGCVTDLTGNKLASHISSFTVDSITPKVSSTTPTNLKTGVSRTTILAIKFSENIKSSTYYNNITIKNLTTGKYVTISKAISGNTLYIKTSTTRTANTWYQVTIPKSAIKDYAGNNLLATYTFKFKTGA